MGKVIEFKRETLIIRRRARAMAKKVMSDVCPCGWLTPKNVNVFILDEGDPPELGRIEYDCPQCGKGREIILHKRPDDDPAR